MQNPASDMPSIRTPQELDTAVRQYVASDLSGLELFNYWQAIREASLRFSWVEFEDDRVPGEDSY